jgi:hypothetical protein
MLSEAVPMHPIQLLWVLDVDQQSLVLIDWQNYANEGVWSCTKQILSTLF